MAIAIIGTGGHARVVQDVLLQRDGALYAPYHSNDVPDGARLYLGIGNRPVVGNSGLEVRALLFAEFGPRIDTLVAPTANVRSRLGVGAQVLTNAVIQVGCVVGDNVLVNTGAVVEHDCFIGDHTHIAPGALLCGGASVGSMTHIGARAVVKQGVKIGSGCVVGMGAVVRRNMADGETVF